MVEFAISSTTVNHKGKEGIGFSKEVPIYHFYYNNYSGDMMQHVS
jgi:hypothetical protein